MSELLKILTCGSVDDGKSTLIGRLLYETGNVFLDQKDALLETKLKTDSDELDYSSLLDGLSAEQEQRITIDVAYRYFTTKQRRFIVADCPGHKEYTRNMAVGASFADAAIILVDARHGILPQTKQHIQICQLVGIQHYILLVNKMDLIGYDQKQYDIIREEFDNKLLSKESITKFSIPISATVGDNVTHLSKNTPWYIGKTLLEYLDTLDIHNQCENIDFLLPILRVCHLNGNQRLYQGQIESGMIHVNDSIIVLPSKEKATVKNIFVGDKQSIFASSGSPISIELNEDVDISRGDIFTNDDSIEPYDCVIATILWLSDEPLIAGRNYILRCAAKTTRATILSFKGTTDISVEQQYRADTIDKNHIVQCKILFSEKIVVDTFKKSHTLGAFILIDIITFATAGCGVVMSALHHFDNLTPNTSGITREIRSVQKQQQPITLWFTGLPASGKSTLANEIEHRLIKQGKHTMLLDGDNLRQSLNRDLGFSESDRTENIRRIAEVSKILNDAGLIAIAATISPYSIDRTNAKDQLGNSYIEIYLSTPVSVCEKRDPKGLYKKAKSGLLSNFTGIDAPYEKPLTPDIEIDTSHHTVSEAADIIMSWLIRLKKI